MWWQIILIVLGIITGFAIVCAVLLFVFAAIIETKYEKKYPDWKNRGR